jgi:hypothetical protein
VNSAERDYCFVKFETTLKKVKKVYQDPRSAKCQQILAGPQLTDVVTRNLADLVGSNRTRGLPGSKYGGGSSSARDWAPLIDIGLKYAPYAFGVLAMIVFFILWRLLRQPQE